MTGRERLERLQTAHIRGEVWRHHRPEFERQRDAIAADLDRLQLVRELLSEVGCECDVHPEERDDDLEPCFACRVASVAGS